MIETAFLNFTMAQTVWEAGNLSLPSIPKRKKNPLVPSSHNCYAPGKNWDSNFISLEV